MRGALLILVFVLAVAWLGLAGCAPTGPAVRDEERDEATCTTDLECSPGDECIRPRGQINGLCGHLADSRGGPTTTINRHADPCESDFDCPVRSRCERTSASVGLCVSQ